MLNAVVLAQVLKARTSEGYLPERYFPPLLLKGTLETEHSMFKIEKGLLPHS